MVEYHCYFFGPDDQPYSRQRVPAAAERFEARTDDEARMKAHMAFQRLEQAHGFEVWQADMLVYRHASPSLAAGKAEVESCG
jgi:hypothetical protein